MEDELNMCTSVQVKAQNSDTKSDKDSGVNVPGNNSFGALEPQNHEGPQGEVAADRYSFNNDSP